VTPFFLETVTLFFTVTGGATLLFFKVGRYEKKNYIKILNQFSDSNIK